MSILGLPSASGITAVLDIGTCTVAFCTATVLPHASSMETLMGSRSGPPRGTGVEVADHVDLSSRSGLIVNEDIDEFHLPF